MAVHAARRAAGHPAAGGRLGGLLVGDRRDRRGPRRIRDRARLRVREPARLVQDLGGRDLLLGGIAGATIANAVNIKRQDYRFRFFQVADAIAPCLALGISVGRIGDLIIGDHLGKPTSWLLAWTYEGGTLAPLFRCAAERCAADLQDRFSQTIDRTQAVLRDAGQVVEQGIGVHQTAMYDMILAGLLFVFLWWFIRSPRREGIVTLTFGLAYGCIRLLEDSLRIDKRFDRSPARSGRR